jgi:salicylate hydroxylase
MRVIVAGGGIGGLTTAIALRHHGIDALVLEQAETMAEIGAGIQIASNAAIVLREIGLEQAIRAVGVKPQSYDYRDLRTGRMLYKAPLGDEAAGGATARRCTTSIRADPGPDPVRCGPG